MVTARTAVAEPFARNLSARSGSRRPDGAGEASNASPAGSLRACEQRGGEANRSGQSSGKKRAISRAADSAESDPWAMFSDITVAKSPRIVPGAA